MEPATRRQDGESSDSREDDLAQLRSRISAALPSLRNSDGGWAYRRGKASRIEPTCWALLALGRTAPVIADTDVLRRWPRTDRWLVDVAGAPVNHAFNAIAALTLLQQASTAPLADPVINQLIASKGVRIAPADAQRQNNSLQAWSWVDGTFSWTEPTAWCLLLLKQRLVRGPIRDAPERIRVGEEMLIDRACRMGGWNYGNSNVYGQDLEPYVPTTALALLALQDRRSHATVLRGVRWLEQHWVSERSAAALSLSIICLRAYGLTVDAPARELAALIAGRTPGVDDDVLGLGMALYALSDRPMTAFTVGTS